MPDTPLSDRAARFASLATAERESLVTELLAENERITAERDAILEWLIQQGSLSLRKTTYRSHAFDIDHNVDWFWAFDGKGWHAAQTPLEAVRKAAGLDGTEDTDGTD